MLSRANRWAAWMVWVGGGIVLCLVAEHVAAQTMEELAQPKDGRSMRSTSTAVDAQGNYAADNADNSRVASGATKVVLDAQGPGVVTHMWFTFLGPEPQEWVKSGSANHQEMLLRVFYDGQPQPAIEVPLGDFFANCFGKRAEVISVPVVVEDADSYNCFWHMPFRKSIRIEVVNQSAKQLNLLYYNIDWIKQDRCRTIRPTSMRTIARSIPSRQGKDYVILETAGQGALCGHRAVGAHAQSVLVRRGR